MTHSSSRINPRVTGSYPVTPPFGFCEGSICRLKVHCFPKVYIYISHQILLKLSQDLKEIIKPTLLPLQTQAMIQFQTTCLR